MREQDKMQMMQIVSNVCPKDSSGQPLPLAIGIHRSLKPRLTELGFSRNQIDRGVSRYTRHKDYLHALASGEHRYDLDGRPVSPISDIDRSNARTRLEKIRDGGEFWRGEQ